MDPSGVVCPVLCHNRQMLVAMESRYQDNRICCHTWQAISEPGEQEGWREETVSSGAEVEAGTRII